jgi:hypothetical protein
MCNTSPCSTKVTQYKWPVLRYILWMPEDTHAQKALELSAVGSNKYKACKERHITTLINLLRADLRYVGLGALRTVKKRRALRTLTRNKVKWIQMKD